MEENRINYVNNFLKDKFGERTLKICIDGGFTCPNRDSSKSTSGCIFCSESGSGDHLNRISISKQIEQYFSSYRVTRANCFIIYFQNFTNTYASIEVLKSKYDEAIKAFKNCSNKYFLENNIQKKLVGLQIATRPDCVDEDIASLISDYSKNLFVTVELGLQTANDSTGDLINRCYSTDDFINAVNILKKHNINIISHIMVGLPKETHNDIENTIRLINSTNIDGVKIHSTYIVKNTKLEALFKSGAYSPISLDDYLNELLFIITHISPKIVIHRVSGDAPKDLLVAPEWNLHKKWVLNGINKLLKEKNLYQGINYKEKLY